MRHIFKIVQKEVNGLEKEEITHIPVSSDEDSAAISKKELTAGCFTNMKEAGDNPKIIKNS
ncbi:MAG: hypothetical protein ABH876_01460 [Patescibacteria group bacterium]|nr:hypothetical protein [Patescibacteria group bacterium]